MKSLGAMGRDRRGGGQNWWSMKWDFETGAGRVDLTKEGGMSQEQRQGRGTKRRWPACWGRPTHCYWTTVGGAAMHSVTGQAFGVIWSEEPRKARI